MRALTVARALKPAPFSPTTSLASKSPTMKLEQIFEQDTLHLKTEPGPDNDTTDDIFSYIDFECIPTTPSDLLFCEKQPFLDELPSFENPPFFDELPLFEKLPDIHHTGCVNDLVKRDGTD